MGFFITEEKELPEFSNQDANKVLKVDPSGVYLQWLQETTTPAELPSQAGNNGRFLTTNGSVPSWAVVNQVPTPSATGQILNSTGAATYTFTDNPTIDIIRTGSGSGSGLRIGASNTGLYGLSSTNVMGIITGNVARQTWDSAGSIISVPLTVSNGLCLTFLSQATNRTMTQTDATFQRINYTSNNVTYTLPPLANGTQFWFNPFASSGTFTCTLTTSNTSTGMETYYDGVRSGIPNTGSGTIPPAVTITMGYIYHCVYFANVTSWLIIRHGTDKNGVIGNLTITSNLFVQGTGTNSIAGQLNLTAAGSAAAPTLLFGDSTVPQSGIWGTDGSIRIGTDGVERLNINNTGATLTGNLVMAGTTGGVGVIASTADAAGLYSTTNTTTGIRFNNTNNNLRILCNTTNIIDCTRNSSTNEGLASIEEALAIKKCVRAPMVEVNAAFTVAVLTPQFLRVQITEGNQIITLGVMPIRCDGQYHTIIPYKSSVNSNRLYITTSGSTTAEIHYYENKVRTVITGNTQFEIFEGVVYQCIYKSTSASTGIWYVWPDCNTASQDVVTVNGIYFGGTGSYITGTSAGQSSTMTMQLNSNTVMSTTQDDFSIFNTLKLSKAISGDFIVVDDGTFNITRDIPRRIILTKAVSGSATTNIHFPSATAVPNGLEVEVIVWNLPGKNGTGYKRIRFNQAGAEPNNSAFVIGASNLNMMALQNTIYEVAEGTWFRACCMRVGNGVPGETVNRWFVNATRWIVPSGGTPLDILPNADT